MTFPQPELRRPHGGAARPVPFASSYIPVGQSDKCQNNHEHLLKLSSSRCPKCQLIKITFTYMALGAIRIDFACLPVGFQVTQRFNPACQLCLPINVGVYQKSGSVAHFFSRRLCIPRFSVHQDKQIMFPYLQCGSSFPSVASLQSYPRQGACPSMHLSAHFLNVSRLTKLVNSVYRPLVEPSELSAEDQDALVRGKFCDGTHAQ